MPDMCKKRPWISIFSFRTGFMLFCKLFTINEIALIVFKIVKTLKMVPEAPSLSTQQWVSSIKQALGHACHIVTNLCSS